MGNVLCLMAILPLKILAMILIVNASKKIEPVRIVMLDLPSIKMGFVSKLLLIVYKLPILHVLSVKQDFN